MPLTDWEKVLFALAREYVTTGRLPRAVPASLGAGPGTRVPCSLCEYSIDAEQVEYEFTEAGGKRLRFHIRCHAIWQLAADDRIGGG